MNIIRKYKLHKLFKNSLTKKEIKDFNIILKYIKYSKENYEVIEFIYNNFFNLEKVKFKGYPNKIFYFKDGKFIFEFYHEIIIVNNELWEIFENKFKYNNYTISYLFKFIIEKAYKLNIIDVIKRFGRYDDNELEILYKIFKK